jgi:magnesium transporter
MTAISATAVQALNRRYLLDYPHEAALRIETMSSEEAAALLAEQPLHVVLAVWRYLVDDVAVHILKHCADDLARRLVIELEPMRSAAMLTRIETGERERLLSIVDADVARELRSLLHYPQDSAGASMDPRFVALRRDMTVADAEARLRLRKPHATREFFLVDDEGRLDGRIEIQDLLVADPHVPLNNLARAIIAVVQDVTPREEVVEKFEQFKLANLPVVDFSGRVLGVIHQEGLVSAMQQETSLDIQTMVGASRHERALSPIGFSVKQRLPWLNINLATAFLAAAVVGLFENTIAQVTALAVLMPIVAGQSGNAGAQALAVTMRGLVLREIATRHALRVLFKEIAVGFFNGVAIALVTAIGVYLWSKSLGLAVVIALSMVLSMIAAGFAGALIPITLQRLGQDPAQSSSIVLTTVTDVVGFMSFLGIATLLLRFL